MRQQTCLHILGSSALHVSRVLKEARSFIREGLAKRVVLLAKWNSGLQQFQDLSPGISVRRIKLASRLLPSSLPWQIFKEMEWRRRVVRHARELQPSTIFCHGLMLLRTAVEVKQKTGAGLVYDAHELETETIGLKGAKKRLFSYLERRFIRECGAVICVSDSIADWYARHYGITRPAVVRNIPDLRNQAGFIGSDVIRDRFHIPRQDLIFIYQGGLAPGRRVEQMLRIFSRLQPNRHLVFMGFGPLEPIIKEATSLRPNIHLVPAVPPEEVLKYSASADVGIVGVENSCLSYYFSLPNKMFEYLLAGIPVLVPDYPEMRRVIDTHGCGWVVPDGDDSWQSVIESLSFQSVTMPKEKARAVGGGFSWENEEVSLFAAHKQAVKAAQL